MEKYLDAPWIALPSLDHLGLAFGPSLVCRSLWRRLLPASKTIGNLTTCPKINDDEWKRLDVKSVGNGLFAEGIGTIIGYRCDIDG